MSAAVIFILLIVTIVAEEFNTNSFSCKNRETGFYADITTNCRVYHNCDNHGNKFTYKCPEKTAFRQEALVCDHEYLVNCKQSAKLIKSPDSRDTTTNDSKNSDDRGNYSRSFRITAEPSQVLLAPRRDDKKPTTFFMSSTVFLRDQSNLRKNLELPKSTTTTTLRPQQFNEKPKVLVKPTNFHDKINSTNDVKSNISQKFSTTNYNSIAINNYPYRETLRSIQTTKKAYTTPRTTTAGTEFPIPKIIDPTDSNNPLLDDPYYPRNPTTTEAYYVLSAKNKPSFTTSNTRIPWLSNVNLKIPDVLPDLNSLEDIVDRRKHFFIPQKSRDTQNKYSRSNLKI